MDWLQQLGKGPVDLAAKHAIAQSTKQFFGFGPKGRVLGTVQGDLAVFAFETTGPEILKALPASAFGRLAMRHITELYRDHVAQLLATAGQQLGVGIRSVLCDLDFAHGFTLGIATLERTLAPMGGPAPAPLARAAAAALAQASGGRVAPEAISVQTSPALLTLRCPPLPEPEGEGDAALEFARLEAWDGFRTALQPLLTEAARPGGRPGPVFAAQDDQGLVAGVIWER